MNERPTVLVAVSSLGLGHASRSLCIIRSLLSDHAVHLIAHDKALAWLKEELGDSVVYHDVPDYPRLQRGTGIAYYAHLLPDVAATLAVMWREHRYVEHLARTVHFSYAVSDGRYGCYLSGVPSFIIMHQVHMRLPGFLRHVEPLLDAANAFAFRRFTRLLIPDCAAVEHSLAGNLSHHGVLKRIPHTYVGILSSLEPSDVPKDIDLLVHTQGFLADDKPDLTNGLIDIIRKLPGRKALITGRPSAERSRDEQDDALEWHGMVSGEKRHRLYGRARRMVTRAGYTSIMDAAQLNIPALLIPTPGQTEQEYLAEFLKARKGFASSQGTIPTADEIARVYTLDTPDTGEHAAQTVSRVRDILTDSQKPLFFSIIIPACNEASYLRETLAHVRALEYPHERLEVIVVENGSHDETRAIAEREASLTDVIRVLSSAPGVSRARNVGLSAVSSGSAWTIFLDADTHLPPDFLVRLERVLRSKGGRGVSSGTCTMRPFPDGRKARAWYALYNIGHRLTRTSFSLFFMRTELRSQVAFDGRLRFAEDLDVIRKLKPYGTFKFVVECAAAASTRRFENVGWVRQCALWCWQALVHAHGARRFDKYPEIR